MKKYSYSDEEQQLNNVLQYHSKRLDQLDSIDMSEVNNRIAESEDILKELGYSNELDKLHTHTDENPKSKILVVPTWEELCDEAEKSVGDNNDLESIFTEDELRSNELSIRMLKEDFNSLHRLDKFDICLSAIAGILGATIDILLVGIPKRSPDGLKAGPLSDYIRDRFDKAFPQEEMEKLANSKVSKVPYDAQDNRNTKINVDGLSAYYHRLLSLGHDPILGFIFGVADILNGTMTTIDKSGRIVIQVIDNYSDRKESNIFAAIANQIAHLKSDINTSMGLPAPLMGLFNLLQFGSFGEEEQTIAEIVQGMYYEGYDFIHFCAQSIPVMIVEVIVRIGYAIKRIKEGYSIKDSIPVSLNREKHPKLATMLFIGHSAASAINAGRVFFVKDPMAINYAQWLAFGKYSFKQLKWVLKDKPKMRDAYVEGKLYGEYLSVIDDIDSNFKEFSKDYVVVIKGEE